MTLANLISRMHVERTTGYGQYRITITFRGKEYTTISNNTLAWDSIHSDRDDDRQICDGYTLKQAFEAFYIECKRNNDLM